MLKHTTPPMHKLPGGWLPSDEDYTESGIAIYPSPQYDIRYLSSKGDDTLEPPPLLAQHIIPPAVCDRIVEFMMRAPRLAPVSVQGMAGSPGGPADSEPTNDKVGSLRTTTWSPPLAAQLEGVFESLPLCRGDRVMNDYTATDWWQEGMHRRWRYVGVSPMLRYMRYEEGGEHYAHYDAAFIYPDPTYRTLTSVVIYLSTNSSGATRFVRDNQSTVPVWNRRHEDWSRRVVTDEVVASSLPTKGSVLFFDHRLCHDVAPYDGAEGSRIIIRGDLIYHAVTHDDNSSASE